MSDITTETNISINGKLTVTVTLKGTSRRYNAPDINATLDIAFGAKRSEIEDAIERELAQIRRRLLIASGVHQIEE